MVHEKQNKNSKVWKNAKNKTKQIQQRWHGKKKPQKPKVGTPDLLNAWFKVKHHLVDMKGRELGYENVTFGGPSREVAEEAQLEESQEKSCK